MIKKSEVKQFLPMIASLALLSCFLSYYMIKTYENKKKEQQKEAGYIFENAFKIVETEALDEMVVELKGVSFIGKDTSSKKVMIFSQASSVIQRDSLTVKSDSILKSFTKEEFVFNSSHLPSVQDTGISIKIQINNDKQIIDTSYGKRNIIDLAKVEKILKEKMLNSNFLLNYSITQDSTARGHKNNPGYFNVFSNQHYYLNIDNNKFLLFNKILPELLLSLGLFFSLLYALYHTITSFRKKQEVYNLKEDFIRNMTHELKTPISTIGIALEAAQNFTSVEDHAVREEYYRIAENENQKLNTLVDKVLSISQYMDNQIEQKELVNLCALTKEIVDSFKLKASQKNISIDVIANPKNEDIFVNQQILVMCLHNLIDNAIKYVKSEQPMITITINELSDEFVIDVSDNGTPIEESQKNKIFEKFYRIPQGDVHDVKGHGLGLYIVSQLAISLKGKVSLKNNLHGNTFSLLIPK